MSAQQTKWPIKGVRVDGDQVVISVKGGNNAARGLCGELLLLKEKTPQPAAEKGAGGFADRSIATHSLTLWERPEGGLTSATQLLIRPLDVRCDESGEHADERFVMVTITREEMRSLLAELDKDWEETVQHCGDPNQSQPGAAPQPVAVPQGYALVPVKPTPEMLEAGLRRKAEVKWADGATPFRPRTADLRPVYEVAAHQWTAMLAASPQAPSREPHPTREDLIAALTFYANKDHFQLADDSAWDTVSGEPANFWCDEAGTATVEDGTLAKLTLEGKCHAAHFADEGKSDITKEGGAA